MTYPQGYKIAVGFNNAAGLVAIETAIPAYQNRPFVVHALGSWDEGIVNYDADNQIAITGDQSFIWIADMMSDVQYNFFQATYTPGGTGLSGKVTVRTLNRASAFANYNAVIQLPKKPEMTSRKWRVYRGVSLHFIVDSAL